MNTIEMDVKPQRKVESSMLRDDLREQILDHSKGFKKSWVKLGQALYAVWQDKMYHAWGFEKFEDYTEKEVGLNKQTSMKLLKAYLFLEQDEPMYLSEEFFTTREASKVPGYEEVNVLRLAKQKKEINKDDYSDLRKSVFEKGKTASAVRKDLTAIMKERKQVDPEEERDKRNEAAIRRLVGSLKSFKNEMDALKLLPGELLVETKNLMDKLETQLP